MAWDLAARHGAEKRHRVRTCIFRDSFAMDITFGAINLKRRANSSEMFTYFRNVFSTLSLSRPTVFLKEPIGIATARKVDDDRYRSAEIFRDPDTKILVAINGDLVNRAELEQEL